MPTRRSTRCSRPTTGRRSTGSTPRSPIPRPAVDFQRLRSQAVAGARAIAAVPLRDARGGAAGWFNVAVNPIAGQPGYSFWHIQDITARHEMERVIRDERNKLVDFLDEAPIGFYSVDGEGRFLFVNPTLAKWLGATPAELVGGDARAGTISWRRRRARAPRPRDPFGGRAGEAQRGEVVLKSRDGRIDPCLDRPKRRRRRRRAAHPFDRPRPDARARMGGGAAPLARALPAVFRQRPGRHRPDRPLRPAGRGQPRAGRIVRRGAVGIDRPAADRLRQRGRPPRARGQARRRGRRRRPRRARSRFASRGCATRPASSSSAGSTAGRAATAA